MKRFIRTLAKIFLWLVVSVLLILISVILLIQVPYVQQKIVGTGTAFLSKKLKTTVRLEKISILFPKAIQIRGFYLEGQHKDTLLYAQEINVDVDLLRLINKKAEVTLVELKGITGHISRSMPDSAFNFAFIMNAFVDSSAKPAKKDNGTSTPWQIDVRSVKLAHIYFTYADAVSGNDVVVKLGELAVKLDKTDLQQNRFLINSIELKNTIAAVIQSKAGEDKPDTGKALDLGLKKLLLSRVSIRYYNNVNGLQLAADIGTCRLGAQKFSLPQQQVKLEYLELKNSGLSFLQAKMKVPVVKTADTAQKASAPWEIGVEKLDIQNNSLAYNDQTQPLKAGLDYSHLLISGLALEAKDMKMKGSAISVQLNDLHLHDKSGLTVEHMEAGVVFDDRHAELQQLHLVTPVSEIRSTAILHYSSISHLPDSLAAMSVNLSMQKSRIGSADLALFSPSVVSLLNPVSSVQINAKISGLMGNLSVKQFQLNAGAESVVAAEGRIVGLPDMDHTVFDLTLEKLFISEKDIKRLVPRKMLPSNLDLPATIAAKGYFRGSMNDFNAGMNAQSSLGNFSATITMYPSQQKVLFNTELTVDNFELGRLLKQQDQIGAISLKIKADGHDLSSAAMEANIEGDIRKFQYNHCMYHNLMLNGCATRNGFAGNAFINDSSLAFTFNGDLSLDSANAHYKADFTLLGADLKGMHFSKDELRVSGHLIADVKGHDINTISGSLLAHNIMIIKNGKHYPVDSLAFGSLHQSEETQISLESPVLSAHFNGNVQLSELGTILKDHLQSYFIQRDTLNVKNMPAQEFTFDVTLKDPSLFTAVLIPGLEKLNPGSIKGSYSSGKMQMKLDVSLPDIQYNGIRLKELTAAVNSDPKELKYNLSLKEFGKDSLALVNTSIIGNIRDSINTEFRITDKKNIDKFLLTAHINNRDDYYTLHFNKPRIILNGDVWNLPADNYLEMGKGRFRAHDMRIENKNQRITFDTEEKHTDISFETFDISNLTKMLQSSKTLAGGILDGKVTLTEAGDTKNFNANLSLKDFSFMQDTLGEVSIKAGNNSSGRLNLETSINGRGNDLRINGFLQKSGSATAMNITAEIPSLNLATFQTLTLGAMKKMSGTLNGKLTVSGTTNAPKISGGLDFKNTLLDPAFIGTPLTVTSGGIYFDGKGVNLKKIQLKDSLGNTGSINGYVYTSTYKDFKFNIGVNTLNLLVLNTPPSDKTSFYGKIFLDSDIKVSGNEQLPVIRAKVKMNDHSHFTYLRSTDPASEDQAKGIVFFVDSVRPENKIMSRPLQEDEATTGLKGIDLSSNIQLMKGADIKVLVDKNSGDSLNVSGTSNLLFKLDPDGRMSLAGNFRIYNGGYLLTLSPLVKRKFTIEKNSTVSWTGDATQGTIDLTAKYEIRASAADLVEDQMEGASDEQKNMYKQRLPFEVYLKIKGQMLKPEITFDIDLPEDQKGALGGSVNARLIQLRENQAELEKQVFALLVLGRFVGQNPFQSAAGSEGVGGAARSSASGALTDQLNNLSGKYVKGVNLNVGVQSYDDYSSGKSEGRTQLQLGLSKGLFNDRVVVHFGTNIDVEGEKAQENSLSSVAGDISVEYKLTPQGYYRLKGFRKQAYEDIIEGELIETGGGFIFVKDYNKLTDLFKEKSGKAADDEESPDNGGTGGEGAK